MLLVGRGLNLALSLLSGLVHGLRLNFICLQMVSAIRQGHCCVSVFNAAKVKPEVFGLSLAPADVAELCRFRLRLCFGPGGEHPGGGLTPWGVKALRPGQHEPGLNP
jgi:hypothetical protein